MLREAFKICNALNNKERYKEFNDKIIHIVVEDIANTDNAWDNEKFQRNCIDRGIKQLELDDQDIIMISDCDEIPDANMLSKLKEQNVFLNEIYSLRMEMYYYNLTCKMEYWYHAKILPYLIYKQINKPEDIRTKLYIEKFILEGGWHLSYFGNVEYNKKEYLDDDKIKECIENCSDLFFREGEKIIKVKIEDNDYLPKNYELLL